MLTQHEPTPVVVETSEAPRACWTCNFWYPGRVALATDTPGACLCMGSPYEMPKADDVCDLWEAVD